MKIRLTRSGGFIPLTRVAETETDFTENQISRLIEIIQPDPSAPRIKDGNYYELSVGTKSSPVDLDKVPDEFKELFSRLKNELKIVK